MQAVIQAVPVDPPIEGEPPQGGGVPALVDELAVHGPPAPVEPDRGSQPDGQRQNRQKGKSAAKSFGHTTPSFQAGSARRMARSAHTRLTSTSTTSTGTTRTKSSTRASLMP